jgi:superfamily I DNA and/or RNA helicase
VPARDIRVISPFRKVVRGSKQGESAVRLAVRDDNVGMVHTVQGQEAHVVVLVLGTAT